MGTPLSFSESDEQKWLAEAVKLATVNVEHGGGPFGALIVRDGSVLATGTNQVTPTLDPTSHQCGWNDTPLFSPSRKAFRIIVNTKINC